MNKKVLIVLKTIAVIILAAPVSGEAVDHVRRKKTPLIEGGCSAKAFRLMEPQRSTSATSGKVPEKGKLFLILLREIIIKYFPSLPSILKGPAAKDLLRLFTKNLGPC